MNKWETFWDGVTLIGGVAVGIAIIGLVIAFILKVFVLADDHKALNQWVKEVDDRVRKLEDADTKEGA